MMFNLLYDKLDADNNCFIQHQIDWSQPAHRRSEQLMQAATKRVFSAELISKQAAAQQELIIIMFFYVIIIMFFYVIIIMFFYVIFIIIMFCYFIL